MDLCSTIREHITTITVYQSMAEVVLVNNCMASTLRIQNNAIRLLLKTRKMPNVIFHSFTTSLSKALLAHICPLKNCLWI